MAKDKVMESLRQAHSAIMKAYKDKEDRATAEEAMEALAALARQRANSSLSEEDAKVASELGG